MTQFKIEKQTREPEPVVSVYQQDDGVAISIDPDGQGPLRVAVFRQDGTLHLDELSETTRRVLREGGVRIFGRRLAVAYQGEIWGLA